MQSDDTSNLDPETRQKLMEVDWDYALSKALKQAIAEVKVFESMGLSPSGAEDMVNDACTKLFSGERKWDYHKYPDLGLHLTYIIRSMASHERKRLCGIKFVALNDTAVQSFDSVEKEIAASNCSPQARTPEELILHREQSKELQNWLDRIAEQDEEVGLMLMCLHDGITKPAEIAETVEWDIKRVNNVLKRTRRKIASLRQP